MLDYADLIEKKSWFGGAGTESDVIVSSRVRLARNLIDHPFPGFLGTDEELVVQNAIVSAFEKLPAEDNFTILYLNEMSPLDRRLLLERNIITQEFSLARDKSLVLSGDESLSIMINAEDHLRLSCIKEGLSLRAVYDEVDRVDSLLEDHLHFAISLEWGYLNSSLMDIGTGMRASVMVHLPALVMAKLIEKALKAIAQVGLSVKGFFGEGLASLGDMYQIANQVALGLSEPEILDNLSSILLPLMGYERKARQELLESRRTEVEDRVFRAFAILTSCRQISSREAIELLSSLRLGIALDLIGDISLSTINALFFISQKSHIQKISESLEEDGGSNLLDYLRAKVIRESLSTTDKAGGL